MSFLKGFFSLFDWMFPKNLEERFEELDDSMQKLYTKMGWGDYKNPMPTSPRNFINPSCNTAADYTRSISSEEWNNMIRENKTVEEVYGNFKAVTSSKLLDEMLKLGVGSGLFQPYVYYNKDMDSVQAYIKDQEYYVKTLDNNIELYLSFATGEVVGMSIFNIQKLIKKYE